MQISTNGIELIKRFEGFSQKAYKCFGGYLTIGYGHKIRAAESFQEISAQQAQDLLIQDLQLAQDAVERSICYPLNQNQFDAITSFVYNVGGAALQRSTLRQKINYAELDNVEHEMLKWVYVKALKIKGLVIRRKAEIELFYRC